MLPDALPAPAGRWARFYVICWVALLSIFVIGTIGELGARLRQGAASAYSWAPLGVDVGVDDKDPYRIGFVTPAATRAGIRVDDRILAVQGVAFAATPDDATRVRRLQMLAGASEGQLIKLRIARAGVAPHDVSVRHRASEAAALYARAGLTPAGLTYGSSVAFLVSSLIMFVGAVVLFRGRREPVGALLSLGLLALAAMMGNQGAVWDDWGLHGVFLACYLIGITALFLSVLVFPDGRFAPRWTKLLAITYPAVALLIVLAESGTWLVPIVAGAAVVAMVVRYRRERATARMQWKWAMIGFALGFGFLAVALTLYGVYLEAHSNDYATILWSWIVTPLILGTCAALLVGGVVLSVLRFRLYDTTAAVSHSLVYAVLTLTLVAVFAGSEKIIEVIGEHYLGEEAGALSAGVAAAVAAATMSPLHHRLSHWAEHLLRHGLLALRQELPTLLMETSEGGDEAMVAGVLLEEVARVLHSVRGAVIVDGEVVALHGDVERAPPVGADDKGATLTVARTDMDFPVRVRLGRRAARWLVLGPRPDGTLFDKDEREVLTSLAAPAGQALAAARRNAKLTARLDALTQELKTMTQIRSRKKTIDCPDTGQWSVR